MTLPKIQGAQVVECAVRESQQIHGGRGYERGRTMTGQVECDLRLKVIGGGSEEILRGRSTRWRSRSSCSKVQSYSR